MKKKKMYQQLGRWLLSSALILGSYSPASVFAANPENVSSQEDTSSYGLFINGQNTRSKFSISGNTRDGTSYTLNLTYKGYKAVRGVTDSITSVSLENLKREKFRDLLNKSQNAGEEVLLGVTPKLFVDGIELTNDNVSIEAQLILRKSTQAGANDVLTYTTSGEGVPVVPTYVDEESIVYDLGPVDNSGAILISRSSKTSSTGTAELTPTVQGYEQLTPYSDIVVDQGFIGPLPLNAQRKIVTFFDSAGDGNQVSGSINPIDGTDNGSGGTVTDPDNPSSEGSGNTDNTEETSGTITGEIVKPDEQEGVIFDGPVSNAQMSVDYEKDSETNSTSLTYTISWNLPTEDEDDDEENEEQSVDLDTLEEDPSTPEEQKEGIWIVNPISEKLTFKSAEINGVTGSKILAPTDDKTFSDYLGEGEEYFVYYSTAYPVTGDTSESTTNTLPDAFTQKNFVPLLSDLTGNNIANAESASGYLIFYIPLTEDNEEAIEADDPENTAISSVQFTAVLPDSNEADPEEVIQANADESDADTENIINQALMEIFYSKETETPGSAPTFDSYLLLPAVTYTVPKETEPEPDTPDEPAAVPAPAPISLIKVNTAVSGVETPTDFATTSFPLSLNVFTGENTQIPSNLSATSVTLNQPNIDSANIPVMGNYSTDGTLGLRLYVSTDKTTPQDPASVLRAITSSNTVTWNLQVDNNSSEDKDVTLNWTLPTGFSFVSCTGTTDSKTDPKTYTFSGIEAGGSGEFTLTATTSTEITDTFTTFRIVATYQEAPAEDPDDSDDPGNNGTQNPGDGDQVGSGEPVVPDGDQNDGGQDVSGEMHKFAAEDENEGTLESNDTVLVLGGTESTLAFSNGSAPFTLTPSQTILISGVPSGLQYSISERMLDPVDGTYTPEISQDSLAFKPSLLFNFDPVGGPTNTLREQKAGTTQTNATLNSCVLTNTVFVTAIDPVKTNTDPGPNQTITEEYTSYSITFSNYQAISQYVTISDKLDSNVSFNQASIGEGNGALTLKAGSTSNSTPAANVTIGGQPVSGVTISYNETNNTVTWIIPNCPAKTEGKVSLTVDINEEAPKGGTVSNQATVTVGSDQLQTDIVTNPLPGVEQVQPHKTETSPGTDSTVKVGDTISYNITFGNALSTPQDITITDPLDLNVALVSAKYGDISLPITDSSVEGSAQYNDEPYDVTISYDQTTKTVTWSFEDVPVGLELMTASLTVTVLDGALNEGSVSNQALVLYEGEEAGIKTENVINKLEEAELVTTPTKTEDSPGAGVMVQTGSEVSYTINFANTTSEAQNIEVQDPIITALDFVSAATGTIALNSMMGSTTSGTISVDGNSVETTIKYDANNNQVTWSFTNFPAKSGGSVKLLAKVNSGVEKVSNVSNIAYVKVGLANTVETNVVTNPVPGNHKFSSAPGDTKTVKGGEEIQYTISYMNNTQTAGNITIIDPIDPNLGYDATLNSGTTSAKGTWYAGNTYTMPTGLNLQNSTTKSGVMVWSIPNVQPNESGSVTVSLKVNSTIPAGSTQISNEAAIQVGSNAWIPTEVVTNPINPASISGSTGGANGGTNQNVTGSTSGTGNNTATFTGREFFAWLSLLSLVILAGIGFYLKKTSKRTS